MSQTESQLFSIGVANSPEFETKEEQPRKTKIRKFRNEETGEVLVLEMDELNRVVRQL